MTREEAQKCKDIIQAYLDGKLLEYRRYKSDKWFETEDPHFDFLMEEYRIKQPPTYIPFESREEFLWALKHHEPYAWLVEKYTKSMVPIEEISSNNDIKVTGNWWSMEAAFDRFTFADSKPFGQRVNLI